MYLPRPCMESIHMDPRRVVLLLFTLFVSDHFVSANDGINGSSTDSTDSPLFIEYGVSGYVKTLTCNLTTECAPGKWSYRRTVEKQTWLSDDCSENNCEINVIENCGIGTTPTSILTIRNMSEEQTGIYKCICSIPSVDGTDIISRFDLKLCPLLQAELTQDGRTQTFNNTRAGGHTIPVMKDVDIDTSCPNNDTISSNCSRMDNFSDVCIITCGNNVKGCRLSLTLHLQGNATIGSTADTDTSSLTKSDNGTGISSAWCSTPATDGISQSTPPTRTRHKTVLTSNLHDNATTGPNTAKPGLENETNAPNEPDAPNPTRPVVISQSTPPTQPRHKTVLTSNLHDNATTGPNTAKPGLENETNAPNEPDAPNPTRPVVIIAISLVVILILFVIFALFFVVWKIVRKIRLTYDKEECINPIYSCAENDPQPVILLKAADQSATEHEEWPNPIYQSAEIDSDLMYCEIKGDTE